jgi:hypothetical protein
MLPNRSSANVDGRVYKEIDSTLVWLDKMQRSKECGIVRRVRNVAGKATNEEKTVEKSAETRNGNGGALKAMTKKTVHSDA